MPNEIFGKEKILKNTDTFTRLNKRNMTVNNHYLPRRFNFNNITAIRKRRLSCTRNGFVVIFLFASQ